MRFFVTMLLCFSSVAGASTVTIDFEELDGAGLSGAFPSALSSKGYVLEHSTPPPGYEGSFPAFVGSSAYGNPEAPDGGVVLNYCTDTFCGYDSNNSPTFTLSRSGGAAFDLFSVGFSGNYGGLELQVTGYLNSGGTVNASVIADGLNWQTLTFGIEWVNLDKVEFLTPVSADVLGSSVMDNIVVSTVPVPAAVWLFGSALAGLGWLKRKQTVFV